MRAARDRVLDARAAPRLRAAPAHALHACHARRLQHLLLLLRMLRTLRCLLRRCHLLWRPRSRLCPRLAGKNGGGGSCWFWLLGGRRGLLRTRRLGSLGGRPRGGAGCLHRFAAATCIIP
jgi:hypothetical protein